MMRRKVEGKINDLSRLPQLNRLLAVLLFEDKFKILIFKNRTIFAS